MKKYSVAIVGATGIVGATVLSILEQRHFPVDKLFLLASDKSDGQEKSFLGKKVLIQPLSQFDFSQTQISFFCAGNDISAKYAILASEKGNIVFDKSSYFRYQDHIPLIIPEVNINSFHLYNSSIIASPNCSTIPIAVALKPIYDAVGIARINVATYQSVSGSGKEAINELTLQSEQYLKKVTTTNSVYPQTIAFNVLPHCDDFEENGYTREEMKIIMEMKKIYNDTELAVNPTTVRVPVFFGHSAALHIETINPIDVVTAKKLLMQSPGVKVIDGSLPYPTPLKDAAGQDFVFVGRLRKDLSHVNGLNLWVVTDNVRKGAALNSIQTAEWLIQENLIN